jgi:hypothetical protein
VKDPIRRVQDEIALLRTEIAVFRTEIAVQRTEIAVPQSLYTENGSAPADDFLERALVICRSSQQDSKTLEKPFSTFFGILVVRVAPVQVKSPFSWAF